MISSASTLFFASLVFNAVTVLGAPIRIPDASSEVIARVDIPAQPAPAAVVDLNATHRKRSRVVSIPRARFVAERDAPVPEAIEIRQPLDIAVPAVEKRDEEPTIQRRYPRKIYHDFYEKREPATTIKESTLMITKTTVADTPADAAALASLNANSGGANAPVVPGAPTDTNPTSVTTLISVSQTTTISSPGATPSAATPPAGGEPPAVPAGGEPATPPAGGDAPAVPAGGAPVATPAGGDAPAVPAGGDPAATPAGGDAPAVPAGGDPAAAATTTTSADTPAATPAPPAGGDAPAPPSGDAAAGTPATPAAGGADAGGDNKPAGGDDSTAASTTTSDATPSATATPAAGDDATPSGFTGGGARRALKATTEPVARRLASSGAAWASSIRRSLVNSN